MRIVAPTGQATYAKTFLVSRVLAASSSAAFGVIAFAVAGAAQVGAYAATAAVCVFAGSTGGGWLAHCIMRYPQVGDASVSRLLRWSTWRGETFTGLAILSGASVASALPSAAQAGRVLVFVLAAGLSGAYALVSIRLGRSMANYQGGAVLITELCRAVSITMPPLAAVFVDSRVPYIAVCMALAISVLALALVSASMSSRRSTDNRSWKAEEPWPTPRKFFAYGAPLGIWIGLSSIYQNADRVMLLWILSEEAAGEYALVYDVASRGVLLPITALSGAASTAVLRLFSTGDSADARSANRVLVRLQAFLLGVMSIPIVGLALLCIEYISWFDGEHAAAAVIIYGAAAVWALGDTLQREVMGGGVTVALVKWLAVFSSIGVVLNLVAIPLFGIVGAAATTLLSATGYTATIAVRTRKTG